MRANTVKRVATVIAVLGVVGGAGFFFRRFQVEIVGRSRPRWPAIEHPTHVLFYPDDVEGEIKRAEAILKADNSPIRQYEALQIYSDILRHYPGSAGCGRAGGIGDLHGAVH